MLRIVSQSYMRKEFEEARIYWDENLEYNPLRGNAESSVGGMIAWLIEAAGDILRELSKKYRDPLYLREKIVRLKNELRPINFRGELTSRETQNIAQIESVLEGLPTPSTEIEQIKTLIQSIIRRELNSAISTQRSLHNSLTLENPLIHDEWQSEEF